MKLDDLQRIFEKLNQADVRFLVVGGMAVVLHGYGRMTMDLDLVLDLDSDNLEKVFERLQELNYRPRVPVTGAQFADEETRRSWIKNKGMTVLNLHSDTQPETPLDLFVTQPFSFKEVYENSIEEHLEDGTSFHFVDLNTLIQMKEEAGREKDRLDIQQLRILAGQDPS